MNSQATEMGVDQALGRVLRMQAKLHRWAVTDPGRRVDDVFNLVRDPAFLALAWDRVRSNTGGRTAGIDGLRPKQMHAGQVSEMLAMITDGLKAGVYEPSPVRAVAIPKANGKVRQLGIPTGWAQRDGRA